MLVLSKVKFISDLHLGHKNITKYRKQFFSVQEHDSFVLENILSNISKRDTLWVLGDICFTKEAFAKYSDIINYCGYLNIIVGNHDSSNKYAQEIQSMLLAIADNFHSLKNFNGYWLSHAPIHPEELRGKLNIHGHTHSHNIGDDRYINVSSENTNYKPINFQDIKAGWLTAK